MITPEPKPRSGINSALIIAGSDKRGTIYGIYDLSEQIGVSPWYWWADVPVAHQDALFVKPGKYVQGEPAVKYRGIFLNDEAPALTGWTKEKFGGFNHQFYVNVFELLLRLKGNYLWPAMWGNAFNEDDPLNPKLADEYGIVMGTSHHEPMLRAQQEWKRHGKGPWNYATNADVLAHFWDEGIRAQQELTRASSRSACAAMAIMPMAANWRIEANMALLEKIVADQREIIAERCEPEPRRRAAGLGRSTRRCRSITKRACACRTTSPCSGATTTGATSAGCRPPKSASRSGGAGHLLSLRLCRRAAQLQVAQHQSHRQSLGADEPGA